MTGQRVQTPAAMPSRRAERAVSRPHDPAEREADRAATVVARGGSVAGWSFASLTPAAPAPVQRQDKGAQPTDDEKAKQALTKTGEALLETKPVKALKDKVLEQPAVQAVTNAVTSTPGLIASGVAIAGGVTALGFAGKALPIQPPAIPLDKITPGLSAKITYLGPVNAPTNVGLTLTYSPPGPKKAVVPGAFQAETDRMAADQAKFRAGLRYPPGSAEAKEQEQLDAAVQSLVAKQSARLGLFIPLTPAVPEPEKLSDEAPVQREVAHTDAANATSGVVMAAGADIAPRAGGRPLDPSTRHSMDARFGYDFSRVRIHDDASAAATSRHLDASAFTVGRDIVFGEGRFDPHSPAGRHLLAHELAHVVQQDRSGTRAVGGPVIHRRSAGEWLGIFFGTEEGTFDDKELHDYLDTITKTGKIDGGFVADNKAREIVRRWKAGTATYDLTAGQKVLLIKEMLDGPTGDEDERGILDLLKLSSSQDLRDMLGAKGVKVADLESDIDGDERKELDSFLTARLKGGAEAVKAGTVAVVGGAAPAQAPEFGFEASTLDARFDSDRTWEEMLAIVSAFSATDREAALHYLVTVRRQRLLDESNKLAKSAERLSEAEVDAMKPQFDALKARILKTDRVLLHFYRDRIPGTKEELAKGTAASDPAKQAELKDTLKPAAKKGSKGTFVPTLPGESQTYEDKLRAELPVMVGKYWDAIVKGKEADVHADPSQVHTLVEFERIGQAAAEETDKVFGKFRTRDALVADRPKKPGTIHDGFDDVVKELKNKKRAVPKAKTLVFYFFQSNRWTRRLNMDHDASPDFDKSSTPMNDEAKAQESVASEFVKDATNVRRLNEIDRNWPAFAGDGHVYFQLFKESSPEKDRLLLWDVFATFIHEYMHILVSKEYEAYAKSFGGSSPSYNTLIEGIDCVLSEIVWDFVEPHITDQALRDRVEGADSKKPPIKVPHASAFGRYASFAEALRLVDLVGIEAVYAAYFLGLVNRIGGPAKEAPKRKGKKP